jgi:hypothetical protein
MKLLHINKNMNPSVKNLQNQERFKLITELSHHQIKDFVIEQLTVKSLIINIFMIYQVLMILIGLFFSTRSVIFAIRGDLQPLVYTIAGLAFTFTLLVFIHEILHGISLKIIGATKVTYGGIIKKFIFYAQADKFVINRRQFSFVALTPFIVIKVITLAVVIAFWNHPLLYSGIIIMSAHSLFCAGDIGLLSFFYRYPGYEIYTYDLKSESKSFFYMELTKK